MSTKRVHRRVSVSKVNALVIHIRGDKALRDADLAALFGISLTTLYARIGGKLWRVKPTAFHNLSKPHERGRRNARPTLAFTQAGVLLVAGMLGDDASLEIGMDIAHALKTRRRSSAYKKRPVRRAGDPNKASAYGEARSRMMTARLHAMTGKVRH